MKRIYHKYNVWEDYLNGMYNHVENITEDDILKPFNLLSDRVDFFNTAIDVLNKWPIASDVNLSNKSINRRSWVGQASCSLKFGSAEIITRIAWGRMTEEKRNIANNEADRIIRIYERKNTEVYSRVGSKLLF